MTPDPTLEERQLAAKEIIRLNEIYRKTIDPPEGSILLTEETVLRHELFTTTGRIMLDLQIALTRCEKQVAELEMEIREMFWLGHNHTGQYGDDGEMQCMMCAPLGMTDYKREPLDKVRECFRAVQMAQLATEATR